MATPDPEIGNIEPTETAQCWPNFLATAALDGGLYDVSPEGQPKGVDVEVLQRMVFYHLQKKIVDHVSKIVKEKRADEETISQVARTLKDYFRTIRDMELIERVASHGIHRGWHWQGLLISPEDPSSKTLLQRSGLDKPVPGGIEPPSLPWGPQIMWWWLMTRMGESTARNSAIMRRLAMGIFGGLSFIGPMLIIILHTTKLTAILTSSLFIIFVAVILSVFMTDATPKDIMASSAAYAAVLVVLVGLSTPPPDSK